MDPLVLHGRRPRAPGEGVRGFVRRALGGLLSELDEVDAGPSQFVRLLQARRLLRAVRWDPAESLLQTLSQESLAPGLEARHQALSQALRQAREQSVPLRVAEWKRLGTVLTSAGC